MNNSLPSISIAIPNYNGARYLRDCIESIVSQEYPRLELYFCDGLSSDESLNIAREYKQYFKQITSISDSGPAEAINRALNASSGQVFQWINSDDILEPGSLHSIGNAFMQDPEASLVAGRVANFHDFDKSYAGSCDNKGLSYVEFFRYCCGLRTRLNWHQPGCWWKRAALLRAGGINQAYKAYFDRDLFLRLLRTKQKIIFVDSNLLNFRFHDGQISHDTGYWKRRELRKIVKDEARYSPHLQVHYRSWLKSHYWKMRLQRYYSTSTDSRSLNLLDFTFDIMKDPFTRLSSHSGSKTVLFSLLARICS